MVDKIKYLKNMKTRNITIMELLSDLHEIEIKLSVYIAHWKICVLTKIVDYENVNSILFSKFSRKIIFCTSIIPMESYRHTFFTVRTSFSKEHDFTLSVTIETSNCLVGKIFEPFILYNCCAFCIHSIYMKV